jgi:hypothetical protein
MAELVFGEFRIPVFMLPASLPGAHPAIKAVSPQAPVTDEFAGDDVNHNGAFFLLDNFRFMEGYDRPRPGGWSLLTNGHCSLPLIIQTPISFSLT